MATARPMPDPAPVTRATFDMQISSDNSKEGAKPTPISVLAAQDGPADLADVVATGERHAHLQFAAHDLQRSGDARLAHRTQSVEPGAAGQRAIRAQRQRLE